MPEPFVLLLRLNINSSSAEVTWGMVIVGLGLGTGLGVYTTITQNALPDKKGQMSASVTFFRQIGGSIGLAAMESVMNITYRPAFLGAVPSYLQRAIPENQPSMFENPSNLLEGPGVLAQIQAGFATRGPQGVIAFHQLLIARKTGLTQGIHHVFLVCLVIMLVAFVVILFLREQPLRSRARKQAVEPSVEYMDSGEAETVL